MKLEKSDLQLETIVSRIRAAELDLQPDFQRGEIWDNPRRQRLVDTILREWYVPAIHIVIDTAGEEVVLDGQQRLAAIRDFFDDGVKVNGHIEPVDPDIERLHGLKYSQLPPSARRAVNRFVITVVTLSDHHPQEPNELFFRLNQSYNLTPPEKRNALHGPARDQVKKIVQELTSTGLLQPSTIGFSNGRLAYDDIIARTCVAVEIGNLRQHINNTVVEGYYRSEAPFSAATIENVRRAGTILLAQIQNTPSRIRFNKGTLQTWLVYCYWASQSSVEIPDDLLARFEQARNDLKLGDRASSRAMSEVMRQYEDRASYRVTDVSSVLIRDLAIHLFSVSAYGDRVDSEMAERLLIRIESDPESSGLLIADFLEEMSWGATLAQNSRAS